MKNQRALRNRAPKDRAKTVRDLRARAAAAVRGGGHHHNNPQFGYDVKQNKAV
jgi:hypothetical protein